MNTSDTIVINTDSWRQDAAMAPAIQRVQIPLFKIVREHDPALRYCVPEFIFEAPPVDPGEFASSLVETCKAANGLGLAATQCGFAHRVFVMGWKDEYVAYFNPVIEEHIGEMVELDEGCLSFPGLFFKVKRPEGVVVSYQDYKGVSHEAEYSGMTARIFQHELDHLNGKCYTDHVGAVTLQMARKKQLKLAKGMKK